MGNIFTGVGLPKMILQSGLSFTLPEPSGISRDGLRVYDFISSPQASYVSESGKIIYVGMRYLFAANLRFSAMSAGQLLKIFKAQQQGVVDFYLNADSSIHFLCTIKTVKHKYFGGASGSDSPGYDVDVTLEGSEYLDSPGYGTLSESDGFGTTWGEDWGNE
jgi:hypothetical protein